jgi:branched-chain amino acid transport system substrate-binding protein
MNKKLLIGLGVIILIIVAILIIATKSNKEPVSNETIKIGSILPMTGDFAMFGESINQGAQLAIKELQEKGHVIEYVAEDDKSTASGSVNAANKLLNVTKAEGVITATVQEVKPVKNQFDAGSTPLLAVWDSNNYIKSAGSNIFTIGFSTEDAGYQLANHAVNQGAQKIAVIAQQDEWSELIAGAFENKAKELGGTVILSEKIQPLVKDFRSQITKLVAEKTDAVFIPFLPGAIGPFISQARQQGYTGLILTGDSFSMDEVKYAGKNAEGVVFANLHSVGADALAAEYQKQFGAEPTDALFVTFGYNGVKTLVAAIELAKKKDIAVSDALRQTKVEGVDGTINFQGKQYSEKLEKLYRVEGGQFVEIK